MRYIYQQLIMEYIYQQLIMEYFYQPKSELTPTQLTTKQTSQPVAATQSTTTTTVNNHITLSCVLYLNSLNFHKLNFHKLILP